MTKKYAKHLEFKDSVLELAKKGRSVSELAREYGIPESTIRYWLHPNGKQNKGNEELIKEIKLLKRKLSSIEEENEILKKATAILAQMSKDQ